MGFKTQSHGVEVSDQIRSQAGFHFMDAKLAAGVETDAIQPPPGYLIVGIQCTKHGQSKLCRVKMKQEESMRFPMSYVLLGLTEASKFDKMVATLRKRPGVRDPEALAAAIGREHGKIESDLEPSEPDGPDDVREDKARPGVDYIDGYNMDRPEDEGPNLRQALRLISKEAKELTHKNGKQPWPDDAEARWKELERQQDEAKTLLRQLAVHHEDAPVNGPAAGCDNYDDGRDACMDESRRRVNQAILGF